MQAGWGAWLLYCLVVGLLGCWVAWLLGCLIACLLGGCTAGLLDCWVVVCLVAGPLGCLTAGLLGCLIAGLMGCLAVGCQHPSGCGAKSTKLGTKIDQDGGSKSSKIGAWRGLGAILAHLGPKDPPRAQNAPKCKCWLRPFGGHFGAQNRSKIDLEAIQKVIIFLIALKIDFWSDLVPTWPHLGPPNPPKMVPSWVQNRSKLGC